MEYYNYQRYHESLKNLKPVDVHAGRGQQILDRRGIIKRETLQRRRQQNLGKAECISWFLAPNAQKGLNRYTVTSSVNCGP